MKRSLMFSAAVVFLMLGSVVSQAEAYNRAHGSGTESKTTAVNAPKVSDALAEKLLPPYLAIRAALAADSVTDMDKNATTFINVLKNGISKAVEGKKPKDVEKDKKLKDYVSTLETLIKGAEHFTGKGIELKHARPHFGVLSDLLVSWVRTNVSAKDAEKYQLFYCGMAKHYWFQKADEEIGNPYYGSEMLSCGEKKPIFAAKDDSSCGAGACGQKHDHMDGM